MIWEPVVWGPSHSLIIPCMKLGRPMASNSSICTMGISTLCSYSSFVIPTASPLALQSWGCPALSPFGGLLKVLESRAEAQGDGQSCLKILDVGSQFPHL